MKSRFNALDLRAVALELQPLLSGARVLNIYDHANRSFVIKLATPNQKHYLIIEPGVRLHLSQDALLRIEQQKKQPTGLAMKLRKCLKGRRLMRVEQCGWDRSVRLEFGYYQCASAEGGDEDGAADGEDGGNEAETAKALNLFVEFFAQGNLVLCEPEDSNRVLAVSRPITDIPGIPELITGSYYTPNTAPMPAGPTLEECQGAFRISKAKELKNALRSMFSLLPLYFLDLCKTVSPDYFYIQAKEFYDLVLQSPLPISAAIVQSEDLSYQEFIPLLPPNNDLKNSLMCANFNEAVDKYFLRQEEESARSKQNKLEESAQHKLQAIQGEQQARIDALNVNIHLALQKAQSIEQHADMVQAVSAVVKVAVENGMDWRELEDLIREEKRNQRPTAMLINKLKLEKHLVEITLGELQVDINYTLSLHGNANWYYEQRKQAMAKLDRTVQATDTAMRSAKNKIEADLHAKRSATSRALIRSTKRSLWFEKYSWFLSSDNYLVLAGHDAQQNDLLVKRHLLKDDLYVHAQVNGAASVIIKNHVGTSKPVPPKTLNEAGAFSVLHSRAWEGKVVIGSWWVRAEQVSKTAPSGEYLGTGSFMVRGRKNFIPPAPLQAGFGFLFLCTNPKKSCNTINDNEEVEGLSEKYERALEVEQDQEDAVELVESGNVLIVPAKKSFNHQHQQPKPKVEEPSSAKKQNTNNSGVRGKKGKLKKIKDKYKDQDEEERRLKMALLGNPSSTCPVVSTNDTKEAKVEKKQEIKEYVKKVKPVQEEAAPTEEFSVLDHLHSTLTDLSDSNSTAEGTVQQAIPVCGPWSAMKNYQFRVKLVPQVGSGPGKGKLCKNIVTLLTSSTSTEVRRAPPNTVELIRAVTDVDLQHSLSLNKCAMQLGATDSQTLRKHNKKKSPK